MFQLYGVSETNQGLKKGYWIVFSENEVLLKIILLGI